MALAQCESDIPNNHTLGNTRIFLSSAALPDWRLRGALDAVHGRAR